MTLQTALDQERAGFFRAAARPRGLQFAMQAPALQLADDLAEASYEAEAGGNPKRARYLLDWSRSADTIGRTITLP